MIWHMFLSPIEFSEWRLYDSSNLWDTVNLKWKTYPYKTFNGDLYASSQEDFKKSLLLSKLVIFALSKPSRSSGPWLNVLAFLDENVLQFFDATISTLEWLTWHRIWSKLNRRSSNPTQKTLKLRTSIFFCCCNTVLWKGRLWM